MKPAPFREAIQRVRQSIYVFPAKQGWKTREQVAEELGCHPRAVSKVLRRCIKGPRPTVETKLFHVYDKRKGMTVPAAGYRVIQARVTKQ